MINLSDKSISELEQVVINYENEEFEKVQSCAIELRNRNKWNLNANGIVKHFGLSDVGVLFNFKYDTRKVGEVEKTQIGKLNFVFLEFSKSFGTIFKCIIMSIIINIFYILILFNSDSFNTAFAVLVSIINLALFVGVLISINELTFTSKNASNMDFNKN